MNDGDEKVFHVTVNGNGDYSIWPSDRVLPRGWDATEIVGDRSACLAYIDREWTALTPAPAANGGRVSATNVREFLGGEKI